ncbi:putative n-acetylmuramoyl-L-alanine amidase [Clostridioides difficile F665]|uniref:hypothetical protein n=1 Tax=Clostridioides difficile TaxID=1496 RepID=UPI0003B22BE4|nr:hypothetical protein [Clostridioides difficile]ERM43997.1 putative n-acetylmuramoyl-L-alanine amidase [Clostridioides difficile F665]
MATLLALTFIFMPIKEVFAYEPTENIKKVNKQEKNIAKKEVINLSDNDLIYYLSWLQEKLEEKAMRDRLL